MQRVCHSGGMVEFGPLASSKREIGFTKDPPRYVPIPDNARRMRTELTERFRLAEGLLEASDFFPRTGSGRLRPPKCLTANRSRWLCIRP